MYEYILLLYMHTVLPVNNTVVITRPFCDPHLITRLLSSRVAESGGRITIHADIFVKLPKSICVRVVWIN